MLLSAFAPSLVLSLQHSPGQLWDSEAISRNLYITHHYFSSLGPPSLLRTVVPNPEHGSILDQQVLAVPHHLGLGRILTGMIFFCLFCNMQLIIPPQFRNLCIRLHRFQMDLILPVSVFVALGFAVYRFNWSILFCSISQAPHATKFRMDHFSLCFKVWGLIYFSSTSNFIQPMLFLYV